MQGIEGRAAEGAQAGRQQAVVRGCAATLSSPLPSSCPPQCQETQAGRAAEGQIHVWSLTVASPSQAPACPSGYKCIRASDWKGSTIRRLARVSFPLSPSPNPLLARQVAHPWHRTTLKDDLYTLFTTGRRRGGEERIKETTRAGPALARSEMAQVIGRSSSLISFSKRDGMLFAFLKGESKSRWPS